MGNICKTCHFYRKKRKNITILLTGVDNAGKTSIAKTLAGEPTNSVLQTIGFSLIIIHYLGYKITMYDLGGSFNIREIWNEYYMDVHGLIYVVDASDQTRFDESKRIFAEQLSHEYISGKPVLLLAHKQDKNHALDELEIVDCMNVEYVVNKYKCPTRVEVSTIFGDETCKIDKGLQNGFRWLVENVIQNYNTINERVQRDMENYAFIVEKNREEWRNRMNSEENIPEKIPITENGNPFLSLNAISKSIEENGRVCKPVMIDNFVESWEGSSSSKNSNTNVENSLTSKTIQPLRIGQTTKLKQHFLKQRKRFGRFNKTAPLPLDSMILTKQSDIVKNKELSHSVKLYNLEETVNSPKNYLVRRPATAPPRTNFIRLRLETAWNLSAPLDSVRTITSTDDEDTASHF